MPSNKNNFSHRLWLSVAGIVALVGIVVWLRHRTPEKASSPTPGTNATTSAASPQPVASTTPDHSNASNSRLQETANRVKAAPDAAATREQLAELRRTLASMPTNEAVAEIRRFLDSKVDSSTRLGFKLTAGGTLDESPTLRTFLLDEMARLDPAAAAEYAKVILASKDSPDEWAVALRNLAKGDASADGRALLEQKTVELLQHAPWQENPSAGFLEAFDAAVFVGGTKVMPALSELVRRKDNQAVSYAAFLALDRLVINDPVQTLTALQTTVDSMEGREQTRANYFARGDVRDPRQRELLESYVLNPQISAAELEAFVGVYPNANFMISPNLLTENRTPERGALVARDAESLRVLQEWMADPRFAKQRPALEKVLRRLEEFVRQANQGK
jgi:hypothetical protein